LFGSGCNGSSGFRSVVGLDLMSLLGTPIPVYGTTFFVKKGEQKPKAACFAAADEGQQAPQMFVAAQLQGHGRGFGYYSTTAQFLQAVGPSDCKMNELITRRLPCKFYMDLESTSQDLPIADIVQAVTAGFQKYFDVHLELSQFHISDCTREVTKKVDGSAVSVLKRSKHLVVDCGYAFQDNTQVKALVQALFPDPDGVGIDTSVYSSDREMRMLFQSKHGGTQPLVPEDDAPVVKHLITQFEEVPVILDMKHLVQEVQFPSVSNSEVDIPLNFEVHPSSCFFEVKRSGQAYCYIEEPACSAVAHFY